MGWFLKATRVSSRFEFIAPAALVPYSYTEIKYSTKWAKNLLHSWLPWFIHQYFSPHCALPIRHTANTTSHRITELSSLLYLCIRDRVTIPLLQNSQVSSSFLFSLSQVDGSRFVSGVNRWECQVGNLYGGGGGSSPAVLKRSGSGGGWWWRARRLRFWRVI